jgi:ribosomal-protein-alanine N-acetyltransferase
MLIRKFKPVDIFSVMRIINETFHENYEPAILMDFHSSWHDGFIVAEENNDVVGFILGISPAPNQARILILAVDEKYRRRGTFVQACILRSVRLITLEVRTTNDAAIRFYGKFGFGIVHLIPNYYKDGENGYIMHKAI